MKKGFLSRFVYASGLWMAGVLILLLSASINLYFFNTDQQIVDIPLFDHFYGLEVFGFQLDAIIKSSPFASMTRFLLLLGSALLLQYISTQFRLIRTRSFFPFFFFCVFSAAILPSIPLTGASLACFFFCWAVSRLFAACEKSFAYRAVFDASLLLAIASLFQSRIIYLLPVFWVVMGILQIFSFKSFFASLVGALSIFWIIGGISFLVEDYSFLFSHFNSLIIYEVVDFAKFSQAEAAYTSFLGILMIAAMLSFWPRQNMDKLRTRNYLNSVLLLWFSLLALWLFSNNEMSLLLLLFSLSSLMAAHFFSLTDTLFSRGLFILFILLSIGVYFLIGA